MYMRTVAAEEGAELLLVQRRRPRRGVAPAARGGVQQSAVQQLEGAHARGRLAHAHLQSLPESHLS